MPKHTAVIIGAGPAGLTAAHELLTRSGIHPVVIERDPTYVGGISRTVLYKGNRIDIGGHRFFSKSDRVMDWWLHILPLQRISGTQTITYHRRTTTVGSGGEGPDPETEDRVMLLRSRRSRIYFSRKFFDYPISLSPDTLLKLGLWRTIRIGFSYVRAALFPIKPERNLEEFFINRFGRELYATFFKSYTEKVWGVPCGEISAEWGAQRVKGLSITKAIVHFAKQLFGRRRAVHLRVSGRFLRTLLALELPLLMGHFGGRSLDHGLGTGTGIRLLLAPVVGARHRVLTFAVLILVFARAELLVLGLGGGDQPVVVLGVLEIVLGHHAVAARLGVARQRRVFLGDLLRGSTNLDVGTVAFIAAGQRVGALAIVAAAAASAHAPVLLWPHSGLFC